MRVLYESQLFDVTTPQGVRGPGHVIYSVLSQAGVELNLLGPPTPPAWRLENLVRKIYRRLTGRRYLRFPLSQAARLSARLNAKVRSWKPDVVLSMFPPALWRYEGRAPAVYRVDATYRAMQREYPEYGYSPLMLGLASRLQARSAQRSTLLVTHSDWCRKSLEEELGVPSGKTRVFANASGLSPQALPATVEVEEAWKDGPLHLLFVGWDRQRKGLDIALDVVQQLNASGRAAQLTVCGAAGPGAAGRGATGEDDASTRFVGTFDQSVPEQLDAYLQLYRDADLLLHPTRFDTWGMVTSEAAAFAVPTLTNAVAGMSASVLDGETGLVLPRDSGARAYVASIEHLFDHPELMIRLRRGARRRYEQEMSWDRFSENLLETLREAAESHRSTP